MSRDLLLLITKNKLDRPSEWKNVWSFPDGKVLACIANGFVQFFESPSKQRVAPQKLQSCEVIVIRGDDLYGEANPFEILEIVGLQLLNHDRDVIIRPHLHGVLRKEDIERGSPDLRRILQRVRSYRIGDGYIEKSHPILQFGRMCIEQRWEDYPTCLFDLKRFLGVPDDWTCEYLIELALRLALPGAADDEVLKSILSQADDPTQHSDVGSYDALTRVCPHLRNSTAYDQLIKDIEAFRLHVKAASLNFRGRDYEEAYKNIWEQISKALTRRRAKAGP